MGVCCDLRMTPVGLLNIIALQTYLLSSMKYLFVVQRTKGDLRVLNKRYSLASFKSDKLTFIIQVYYSSSFTHSLYSLVQHSSSAVSLDFNK